MADDPVGGTDARVRCTWPGTDPLMLAYHDEEWGVPLHDDNLLFEALVLDGAQAGLSWSTILKKRDAYRVAFEGFLPERVAAYGDAESARLLENAGIVRNRLKIKSAITNAQRFLDVQREFGSFDAYLWGFVEWTPIVNGWKSLSEIPATSVVSDRLSKDLKARGFTFVGSTIVYAMMQAIGMVNDHLVHCYRHGEVQRLRG